jgi:PAS domain S-box-containing protein
MAMEDIPVQPRKDLFHRIAWLLIPVFLVIIVALWAADLRQAYESQLLLTVLITLFSISASIVIAILAGQSYLTLGSPGLLLFGCGVVVWGAAGISSAFFSHGANISITIHNSLVCISALFHLSGVILSMKTWMPPRRAGLALGIAYTGAVLIAYLVAVMAVRGWMPVFFEQGRGGTPIRWFVLSMAIAMFVASAVMLRIVNRPSDFNRWYAAALLLVATGLFGVMIQPVRGSLLGWAGRSAQFMAGAYMLVAAVMVLRESGRWRISLSARLRASEHRYQSLADMSPEAILIHQDGRIVYANPAALHLFGASAAAELLGRQAFELIHPDDHELIRSRIASNLAGQHSPLHEICILRLDGRAVHVESTAVMTDFDGRPAVQVFIRDITERRKAEAELHRAYESRSVILESISDSFLTLDKEWRFTDVNQRALQYMEKPAQDVLGKIIWEVFPGIAGTPLETFCREAMATRQPMTFINPSTVATGRIFELRAYPANDGLAVFGHEVTERVQLEKELTKALRAADEDRQRLTAVFEALPVAIAITDKAGGLLRSNGRDAEIWGQRPTTKDLDDYDQYKAWWVDSGKPVEPDEWASAQAVTEGRTVTGQMMKIQRFDGQFRFVMNSAAPIYDAEGQIIGSAIAIQDITDLQQARESLRESEALYRAIAQNFPGGAIYVFDRDLRFRVAEGESLAIYGYTRESLEGKTIWEATDEEVSKILAQRYPRVLAGESLKFETELEGRVLSSSYVPIKNDHGDITAGMVVSYDITESRRAEERLRDFNAELETRVAERTMEIEKQTLQLRALASELSRVEQRERRRLAKILHDHIQQLIVAARMQVEWLKNDTRPELVLATAQGVDAILRETLEASRSLTVELSPPVLNEAGLIGGLNWLASRMREKNQFIVNLRSDSKAEPGTEEMRFLLFECARELLFNAVKHAGISEADVVLMRAKSDEIRLIVTDNGNGFDPELLRTRGSDNLSFGLFSIQERLAYIGGRMEIESAPGRGTQVILAVPAAYEPQPAQEKIEYAQAREHAATITRKRKPGLCRTLIVDDHKIMREGLVGLLQFVSDIEVVGEAENGPQAIELAETLTPDVVIMDVNLGDMDGVEATRRILAGNPSIRVIGLSMHIDKDVAAAMRDAGAIAYLTKGGPSSNLIDAIRSSCTYDPGGP